MRNIENIIDNRIDNNEEVENMTCKQYLETKQALYMEYLEENNNTLNEAQINFIINKVNELEAQIDAIDYN